MSLTSGTRLGPYEILSALGAGGMGEVYKARDTRLDRIVAVKVLPAQLADDPQFRERFDREARAISQLTHPHICTLYDVGEHQGTAFLVMEYLEGETLQDRLAKGALPLDQALKTAIEIASALDTAHRAGIVHRDLKPGNVMLTKTGAKLLDFGLAKAARVQGFSASVPRGSQDPHYTPTALPTTPANLTAQGTILGTFQYMAPEQLEGQDADARTDIFAFGALVYEMLTGKKAFEGKSQASLIGAIMHADPPPIATLRPLTPPTLDRLVKTCLAKDPDGRWQSAGDLTRELKWAADSPVEVAERRPGHERTAWAIAAALGVVALGLLASTAALYVRPSAGGPSIQFVVPPPEGWSTRTARGGARAVAMSPDGRRLAFIAQDKDGHTILWVRALNAANAQPLKGTENATNPFWSPDSTFLAFVADGTLKKIDVVGGPPQTIADVAFTALGSWSPDGTILFHVSENGALSGVSATGGVIRPVTTVEQGELGHFAPHFLPDGQHFIYRGVASSGSNIVYVSSLNGKERSQVLRDVAGPVGYSQGRLFFIRATTLLAQAFDAEALKLSGEPSAIAEIGTTGTFSISTSGVLAYQPGRDANRSRLALFDRRGRSLGVLGDAANYYTVEISPDGSHAASGIAEQGRVFAGDVWLYDLMGTGRTRLTFDSANTLGRAIWAPDGKRVVYGKKRSGQAPWDLFQKASNGAAEQALLEDGVSKFPFSWSPDGRFLLYGAQPGSPTTGNDLWVLPLGSARKPFPYLQTQFDENHGQFSPDGRWVAYDSGESGRGEIYVAAFPGAGGKRQISTAGGTNPRWRRDGKELFYLAPNGTLMAVAVNGQGASFEVTSVTALFETHSGGFFPYDVSADGQRFLMITPADDPGAAGITVMVNGTAALNK